jgi:hypothetical protein
MATTTSLTTSYSGEGGKEYIAAALLSGSTIENGLITVKPNVKHKEVLKKVSTDAILKDASCDFTATSTLTLTERIIEPKELQVNLQLCKKDFRGDYEAIDMGMSAHDTLPPSFADFLIGHVAGKVAQRIEQNIWAGDASTSGDFDGISTIIAADANLPAAQEVAGTTVTSSNVIAQLGSIVDAIPSSLYGSEDLHIYVSQNIARAYVRALGGFSVAATSNAGVGSQGTQWWNNGALSFDGVKLAIANGLGDNIALAAEKSNIFFGTGILNDTNLVKVLDMSDLDGSDNVRVIMRMTGGVQYAIAEDIVTYGITNSAN